MRTVLCFGDSNTWGAVPMPSWDRADRYHRDSRWPGILQQRLGSDWLVIAEGLPARTTVLDDPVDGEHFSGLRYLLPCLLSHRPLDGIVLMLGTNDLKRRFNVSAEEVGFGIERLLRVIKGSDTLTGGMDDVLVVAPPPLTATGIFASMYEGAEAKSHGLARAIAPVAEAYGARFLDAGAIVVSSVVDGIHLEPGEHVKLGTAIAEDLIAHYRHEDGIHAAK